MIVKPSTRYLWYVSLAWIK